jgi:Mrp family chromosome partitioning ATPase
MSEECTHDCGTCGSSCEDRTQPQKNPNNYKGVKKVIAVMSGKGGVGKSMVTSMLAVNGAKRGQKIAIMDADITGPSIPMSFGLTEKVTCDAEGTVMYPVRTESGIKVISMNLLMDSETEPVIWRGPIIAGAVKQFWEEVDWGDVDCMLVDCPPGTGDVPLTVLQSIPVAGIVIVTSPQELVSMIVAKAVNMAKMMDIPVLGIVENMSYYQCPDCGSYHAIFGESHIDEVAATYGINDVTKLPINPDAANKIDNGKAEHLDVTQLDGLYSIIDRL